VKAAVFSKRIRIAKVEVAAKAHTLSFIGFTQKNRKTNAIQIFRKKQKKNSDFRKLSRVASDNPTNKHLKKGIIL